MSKINFSLSEGMEVQEKLDKESSQPQECQCIFNHTPPRHDSQCPLWDAETDGIVSQNPEQSDTEKNFGIKKEWEEEFDKRFVVRYRDGSTYRRLVTSIPADIKDFIHSLLSRQKQSLRDKIEARKKEVDCMDVDASEKDGYNQAISEVLKILEEDK